MRAHQVKGTLLLAHEGINGTVAGPVCGVSALIEFLRHDPIFEGLLADLQPTYSRAAEQPFNRTKVRLKREIVTMGVQGIDPSHTVGTYVEPEAWNELIDRDDVLLIDPFPIPDEWERAIGVDFGGANTAILWAAHDPVRDWWIIYDEWLGGGLTSEEYGKKA